MNLDEFSTVVDDRRYINPQVALDESNAFIENLRKTQGQRTAEIAQDTYNLGTAVPSNLGGLGGSGSYFTSRYQTPQTNEIVANLKATAQAQALNDAMNNALAQAKQRYNNAYKSYQRRNSGTVSTSPVTTQDDSQEQVFNEKIVGDSGTVGQKEVAKTFGFYNDTSGNPRYGTLDADYQLLSPGRSADVWQMQNKFPNGLRLNEGAQYTDQNGTTYIYTNGEVYRMWRGAPYK